MSPTAGTSAGDAQSRHHVEHRRGHGAERVPHRDAVLHGKELGPAPSRGSADRLDAERRDRLRDAAEHDPRAQVGRRHTRDRQDVLERRRGLRHLLRRRAPLEYSRRAWTKRTRWASPRSCVRTGRASSGAGRRDRRRAAAALLGIPLAIGRTRRSSARGATTATSSTSTPTWTTRRRRPGEDARRASRPRSCRPSSSTTAVIEGVAQSRAKRTSGTRIQPAKTTAQAMERRWRPTPTSDQGAVRERRLKGWNTSDSTRCSWTGRTPGRLRI